MNRHLRSRATLLAGCLLAALVLFLLWVLGLYQALVAGTGRDATALPAPAELRRLRDQAHARPDPPPASAPPA